MREKQKRWRLHRKQEMEVQEEDNIQAEEGRGESTVVERGESTAAERGESTATERGERGIDTEDGDETEYDKSNNSNNYCCTYLGGSGVTFCSLFM